MQIGFVTNYAPEKVAFAAKAGFTCLEVTAGPGGAMDLHALLGGGMNRVLDDFAGHGVAIGTIFVGVNHLTADENARKQNNEYFALALRTARKLGTCIVTTNSGGDPSISPVENMPMFERVFGEYARIAEGEGVRIGIENYPALHGYPLRVGNICFTPEMFDLCLNAVPSPALGLEYDPSHLMWQGIPGEAMISRYKGRIHAFHAKDTEILKQGQSLYGMLGMQNRGENKWDNGWWRYRLPGFGMIDWKAVFCALYDIGFTGPMIIEHEDPVFSGDRTEEGLLLGIAHLRKYMVVG